jgi:hypothetical protein
MQEQNNAEPRANETDPEGMRIRTIVEAYVNEKVQEAIAKYDASQNKTKKWRNSWRSASPITVASEENHWARTHSPPIAQGTHISIGIPVPAVTEEKYSSGHQMILIVGFATYTDGFPNSQKETMPICWESQFHLTLKTEALNLCDANYFLPILEKADGYPNNEAK